MYSRHEHKLGWDESKVGKVYKALKKLIVNCEVPPRYATRCCRNQQHHEY